MPRTHAIVPSRSFGYHCNVRSDDLQIRRLEPADAALYREIRLEGLRNNPEAFGNTFEAESARPLSLFSERLRDSEILGAFEGSEIVGIAGLLVGKRTKGNAQRHAWLACTSAKAARNRGSGASPGRGGD